MDIVRETFPFFTEINNAPLAQQLALIGVLHREFGKRQAGHLPGAVSFLSFMAEAGGHDAARQASSTTLAALLLQHPSCQAEAAAARTYVADMATAQRPLVKSRNLRLKLHK